LELPTPATGVFTPEVFTALVFTPEVFTTGALLAGGDFGVRGLDTVASSAMQNRTPQPKRLPFLWCSSLRPPF
jgi:hypothetical protein